MNMKKLFLLLTFFPLFTQAQVTLRGKVANMRPGDLDVAIAEYWNVTTILSPLGAIIFLK